MKQPIDGKARHQFVPGQRVRCIASGSGCTLDQEYEVEVAPESRYGDDFVRVRGVRDECWANRFEPVGDWLFSLPEGTELQTAGGWRAVVGPMKEKDHAHRQVTHFRPGKASKYRRHTGSGKSNLGDEPDFQLIQPLQGDQSMATKKTKADELRAAIAALPICADGQTKVTALVETITGETLAKPKAPRAEAGMFVQDRKYGGSVYQVVRSYGGKLAYLDMSSDYVYSDSPEEIQWHLDSGDREVIARSVNEYVKLCGGTPK
jgi:hypothetical protein